MTLPYLTKALPGLAIMIAIQNYPLAHICYWGAYGLVWILVAAVVRQNWRWKDEPPLFGGLVPYVGHAFAFGSGECVIIPIAGRESKRLRN